jgi:hypothetical protein
MMSKLQDLDVEAAQLLKQAGFFWSDEHNGYWRTLRSHEAIADYEHSGPVVIKLDDLSDHGLLAPKLGAEKRQAGLEWLQKKIAALA